MLTIEVRADANNRTFIHEALHAYSVPYITKREYDEVRRLEEVSVEFLAREICKANNIPYSYVTNKAVDALMQINIIMDIEKDDVSFAKLMYNISPNSRYVWLSGKVERYINKHPEKKEELIALLNKVRYSNESK